MTLQWSDEYSCGVRAIDNDHKNLFSMVESLRVLVKANKPATECEAVIQGLVLYARDHFAREEMFMQKAGYPKLKQHRKNHKKCRRKIQALQTLYHNAPDEIDLEKVLAFLETWLVGHIKCEDVDFIPYLKGNLDGDHEGADEVAEHLLEIEGQTYPIAKNKIDIVREFLTLLGAEDSVAKTLEKAVHDLSVLCNKNELKRAKKNFAKDPIKAG